MPPSPIHAHTTLPALALVALALVAGVASAAGATEAAWSLARERDGITVHTRPVAGSGIREFRGSALIPAPIESIRSLLRDADRFKDWFPNTSESRLLEREGNVSYQYSVLDTPWPVSDRDNVFRAETTIDDATGAVSIRISAAPDRHPEQPGRVRGARGEWRLEPASTSQTRVIFTMHLEPGGGVPEWMVDTQVVETPFDALSNMRTTLGRR
jgi:ribosome-associated toxin RatA of RatAB toxin-antitoxin module